MTRRRIAAGALLAILGAALAAPAAAQGSRTVAVRGAPFPVQAESFKCDLKELPGVSVKRLADCDSAVLVTLPGARGASFLRFEIKPSDASISQGVRAELRDMHEAVNGEEAWYRFSTLVPKSFPAGDPHRVVLAQWHERVPEGSPHLRPPLAHRLIDRAFRVTLWDDAAFNAGGGTGDGVVLLEEPAMPLGVAHEYVYRIVWGLGPEARVTGWRRQGSCSAARRACEFGKWARVLDHRGPIGYANAVGYYFKIGLYTTHPFKETMVAFHRDYRRGPTAASVQATGSAFRLP